MAQPSAPASVAPRHSFFAGLKRDFPASIAVTLVALPLCLGIAMACGAPLASGLLAGIIGGIVVGSLSGSHTSVSGPAAGLTAVVLAALHQFDNVFATFLLAVVLAGAIQIVLGVLRAGVISNYFPSAVVSGMLASIGLILIFKQIPHAVGYDVDPEGEFSFFQPDAHNTFSELVYMLGNITPAAAAIAVLCLATIVAWENSRLKKLFIPSALVAVLVGTLVNVILKAVAPEYALTAAHLVNLPQVASLDGLSNFFTFPNWSMIASEAVWLVAIELAFVASLETLLNLEGIDKIDPERRHSPPNRELMAQGIGNMLSGMVGGLPITSVVVRSSVNLNSGAASRKSAIIHGILIAGCVVLIPMLLNQIPLAALAAILLYTGYKLASLKTFREFYQRGFNQFLPFVVTIVAILFTDLLIGVLIGLAVGIFFVLRKNVQMPFLYRQERHVAGEIIRLKLGQQVTFLNRASLRTTLDSLPEESEVLIDAKATEYIDRDI
ncbi:MAG: SulP family inorganic anion transporter, partial [Aureliella sp.]